MELGLHVTTGSRDGYGQTAPRAGVCVATIGGAFDEVGPNCYRIYRPIEVYLNGPPEWRDTAAADMPALADRWWPHLLIRIQEIEAAHGSIDAAQLTNEMVGNNADDARKLVAYERRLMDHAEAAGYTLCVGNLSANSPHWGEGVWHDILAPFIREAWARGHVASRHVYFDVPPLADNWNRAFMELDYLREQGPTGGVVLTELGFVNFPGADDLIAALREYEEAAADYPEIGLGAIFTYGLWSGGAGNANIEAASPQLAEYLEAPAEKWQPPVVGAEPEPVLNYRSVVVLLPQDTTEAELLQVAADVYQQRRTISYSHDEALRLRELGGPGSYTIVYGLHRWPEEIQALLTAGAHELRPLGEEPDPEPEPLTLYSPVSGIPLHITSDWRSHRVYSGVTYEHEGIDLRAIDSDGDPVHIYAVANGTIDQIRRTDPGTGYGKYVRIRHDPGDHEAGDETFYTWYCHLSTIPEHLHVGYRLSGGGNVGVAGSSGNSTGIHLHFGLEWVGHRAPGNFIRGDWVNPWPYLEAAAEPAAALDLLPYFLGRDGQSIELYYTWGPGTHPLQVQHGSDGVFWYVKGDNGEAEELWSSADFIYRGVDFSEAHDRYYVQYTPLPDRLAYGARWCPRFMRVGETAEFAPYVIHYWQADCSERGPQGQPLNRISLLAHHDSYTFPSGITLQDVIELGWEGQERYWFSGGLVGWEGEGVGRSYISQIHDDRPLTRNVPECWQAPERYRG